MQTLFRRSVLLTRAIKIQLNSNFNSEFHGCHLCPWPDFRPRTARSVALSGCDGCDEEPGLHGLEPRDPDQQLSSSFGLRQPPTSTVKVATSAVIFYFTRCWTLKCHTCILQPLLPAQPSRLYPHKRCLATAALCSLQQMAPKYFFLSWG